MKRFTVAWPMPRDAPVRTIRRAGRPSAPDATIGERLSR
jgi:hypothetical protein